MARQSFKAGRPFLFAGTITLPTSGWTGTVALFDMRNPQRPASDFGIAVTVTAAQPNATLPGQTDYVVEFSAPAATTAAWPVRGPADRLVLEGDLDLVASGGQVAGTKRRFSFEVRA